MGTSSYHDGITEPPHHALARVADEIKPRLRGWMHAVMVPVAVVAGIVQVAFAPTTAGKLAAGVFCLSGVLLFTVSAAYHTRDWPEQPRVRLRRWDHANIFLLIAGSYTPFAVLMLPSDAAQTLLTVVWSGALLGAAFQILWVHAPRWLYVPTYIGLGWAAVFWGGDFAAAGQPAVLALVILGGVLYTLGAIVYAVKRPNPAPEWFGFHEIFHSLTIAAVTSHYVGVWLLF
ncbi:MAG TPA: hemolysin III family protein [Nocardioidaceae bacterium]|nr:hemolysin III family protein [Nocardioidaceae bacterium]